MRPFVWRCWGGGKKQNIYCTRLTRIYIRIRITNLYKKFHRVVVAHIANLLLQRKLIFLLDNIFMLRMMRYLKDIYATKTFMSARKTVFDMVSRFKSNGEIKSYNMRMTGPPPILIEAGLTEKQHLLQQREMNKKKYTDVKHSWCKQSWQYSWCWLVGWWQRVGAI